MKNVSLFLSIIILLFSCKEEQKSRLDLEMLGVDENLVEEYKTIEIKKCRDSINFTSDSIKFTYKFDTNFTNYDTNIIPNVVIVNAELKNLSACPVYFLTSNFGLSDNIIDPNSTIKMCQESKIIICNKVPWEGYIPPFESENFTFCFSINRNMRYFDFKLPYKLELISNNEEVNLKTKPYKTLILYPIQE